MVEFYCSVGCVFPSQKLEKQEDWMWGNATLLTGISEGEEEDDDARQKHQHHHH